jgi:hypothetical protein
MTPVLPYVSGISLIGIKASADDIVGEERETPTLGVRRD